MSSAIAILEHLLDEGTVTQKEHVIETNSPRISNVDNRMHQSFDNMVRDISTIWGEPQFNNRITGEATDKHNNVVPTWSKGTARNGGDVKTMRLSYWKRPELTCYIAYRIELDTSKEPPKPLYYDLILGARKRNAETSKGVKTLRSNEGNWVTKVMAGLNGVGKWLSGR